MKSRRTQIFSIAIGTLVLPFSQIVYAADQTIVLDEVVVSGSRSETRVADTPMSIGVVDSETIKCDKRN